MLQGRESMKTGIELIAEERKRQIEVEGWTAEHDDEHTDGELALAAVCYATPIKLYERLERALGIFLRTLGRLRGTKSGINGMHMVNEEEIQAIIRQIPKATA
jgi:hypothetical protein